MSKLSTTKRKLQSKIEAIKKINDDGRKDRGDTSDLYQNLIPSSIDSTGKKWVSPNHPNILNAQNNRVLPIHVSVLLKDKLILQSTSPSCKTRKGILEKYVAYFLLDSLLFCFSLSYLCGSTIMS